MQKGDPSRVFDAIGKQGPSFHPKENGHGGRYILICDEEDPRLAMFDKPLPWFGCGIGWCSFLLGFVLPFMWYYAAILYCCNYYQRDPRERGGLAASALAALIFSVAALVTVLAILLSMKAKFLVNVYL